MRRLRCWLFGHDRMKTMAAHRVCLRCGQREKRPRLAGKRRQVHAAHPGR